MNVHFGLTAGEAFASSSDTFNTPSLFQTTNGVSTNANVPFYGVYAALTGNGLAATFQWRRNLFDLSLTDPALGTQWATDSSMPRATPNRWTSDTRCPSETGIRSRPQWRSYFTQTNVDSLAVGSAARFRSSSSTRSTARSAGSAAVSQTTYTLNEICSWRRI